MRNIFTTIFLLVSLYANSQVALPNPGFELWTSAGTYDNPDNWNTLNPSTYSFGVLTAQQAFGVDVFSGNSAIKLITQSVLGTNATGLATTGTIDIISQTITDGIQYSMRPDSITGWYKCDPVNGDHGFIDFTLLNATGTDTVGFAEFLTPTTAVGTYTYFSVPVAYLNNNAPELSRCVLSSSAGVTAVVNSTLYIDDLALVFNPVSVSEMSMQNNYVRYFSNSHLLKIKSVRKSDISIMDITGKKIFTSEIDKGNSELVINNLHKGIYLYQFTDEKNNMSSGKFIVQ